MNTPTTPPTPDTPAAPPVSRDAERSADSTDWAEKGDADVTWPAA